MYRNLPLSPAPLPTSTPLISSLTPPPLPGPPPPPPAPGLPLPQHHSGAQIKEKPEQGMFVVPPPIKDSVAKVTGTLHQLGSRWSVSNRQHMLRKP